MVGITCTSNLFLRQVYCGIFPCCIPVLKAVVKWFWNILCVCLYTWHRLGKQQQTRHVEHSKFDVSNENLIIHVWIVLDSDTATVMWSVAIRVQMETFKVTGPHKANHSSRWVILWLFQVTLDTLCPNLQTRPVYPSHTGPDPFRGHLLFFNFPDFAKNIRRLSGAVRV
jgi:hypothetical protein